MSSMATNLQITNDDPTERFDFLAKVGEGSYGSVYKAVDRKDGMVVAVKVLDIPPEEVSASDDIIKEINILKHCDSKYIVAYKGSFFKDGKLWIAMEYCGAGSISDMMAICEILLTEAQIAAVMEQCLRGLLYLHQNKKIHRDIKSGNILLTYNGECKLADFGVSAELSNTLAKRITLVGTPYFMAPEVLQQSQYDAKADIWSLGITAYELALGQPPHADIHPMRAIFLISSSPAPRLPDPSAFSKEFNSFLDACLQKDPELRWSAAALLEHPFIKKSAGTAEVTSLLNAYRDEMDKFRAAEAAEQQESKENDPYHVQAAAAPDNTVVPANYHNNANTFVSNNATWVKNDTDMNTIVDNGFSTMISHGQNQYNTVVQNDMGTMVINNNNANMGTMVVNNNTNASGTMVINKPAVMPGDVKLLTSDSLALFNSININSTAADINKVNMQLMKNYEKDLEALKEFYTKKQETLKQIAKTRK